MIKLKYIIYKTGADKEKESEPGNNDHNESNINAECDGKNY